ncbi:hypothetical protein [Undibacterium crateris]|uniref:hypothetical protein n=1 Tax=Undibacterium crateris TaxID=2528175 RepID=UPI001389D5A9|nr:hypothetical protein [Undibacterium crateris]NDI87271.1 hypothetical protein [Undibacterium crateris]
MLLHQSDVESALFSSWSASASVEKRRCAACFILLSPLALALPDQPLAALTALLLLFILSSTLLCKQSRSVQLRCVRQNMLYYAVMMPALLFIVHSKHLAPGLQALITFFFLLNCLLTCLLSFLLFCAQTTSITPRQHHLNLLHALHFLSLSLLIICLLDAALMMLKQIHFA